MGAIAFICACSTPFGIGDDCTRTGILTHSLKRLCSTPFGIGDDCTVADCNTKFCFELCSTPFGIGDDCTTRRGVRSTPQRGAQRLSASEMTAPVGFPNSTVESSCSTPFGIGDDCTVGSGFDFGFGFVCSTPFGIGDDCTGLPRSDWSLQSGAQRLSASEMTAPLPANTLFATVMCAQRLSASEMTALGERGAHNDEPLCSTPFGIGDDCTHP